MNAQELIESYVDDVALRLPRKFRNDVGLELRALLNDELKAAAADAGRVPDADMTMAMLRAFGRPEDVAARYYQHGGFHIIEPEHAPVFVTIAVICVAIQWALTLPRVFSSPVTFGDWWLGWGLGALWWPGLLVVYFGAAAWIRRRWPVEPHSFTRPWTHWILWLPVAADWRPSLSRETLLWSKAPILVPLAAVVTVFFVDPAWLLDRLLPAGVDASWAQYDDDFRRWLRVPLIALMVVRLSLFAVAAVNRRWRAPTEEIRFGLWACFVGLLYWSVFGWDIFASDLTDLAFKAWLSIFLLVNTIQIGVWLRRAVTRVRTPKTLARSQDNHSA
jgi:hypothetical protein